MKENPMRTIKIEKLTLNIGCGDDQAKLEKSKKLLEYLTGKKAVITKSKKRSTFGVAKGKPIGVKVTLRKNEAFELLKKAFVAIENKVNSSNFDDEGNLSFGIKEYIEIPGVRYLHEVGMLGLEVSATLERAGFRIKKRRIQKRKIPEKHKINKQDAMEWFKKNFGVEISE